MANFEAFRQAQTLNLGGVHYYKLRLGTSKKVEHIFLQNLRNHPKITHNLRNLSKNNSAI